MGSEYSIAIDRKAQLLRHQESGQLHCFAMDVRANPMVVYMHEFSDGRLHAAMQPSDDSVQKNIVPRVFQFMIKSKTPLKITFTGARTPRGKKRGK